MKNNFGKQRVREIENKKRKSESIDGSLRRIGLHVDTDEGWVVLRLGLNWFMDGQESIRSFRIR